MEHEECKIPASWVRSSPSWRGQTKARGFKGKRRGGGMPAWCITELEGENSNGKVRSQICIKQVRGRRAKMNKGGVGSENKTGDTSTNTKNHEHLSEGATPVLGDVSFFKVLMSKHEAW